MNAREISERLRNWNINPGVDSAWIEEFQIGDGRLDLLTMDLKAWTIRGFEVKISRADFKADGKWPSYLPFVNYFYFATLPGIIRPEELPPEIGLIEVGPERLVTKKKGLLLQSTFVRETYGERYMTRVIMKFLRDIAWRDQRTRGYCPDCGKQIELNDPRAAGHSGAARFSTSSYGSDPRTI